MASKRIRVNYDNALAQADKLDKLASQCEEQAKEMKNILERIPEAWKGDSGTAMEGKCNTWVANQNAISGSIYVVSEAIRRVVDGLIEAEKRTIENIERGC